MPKDCPSKKDKGKAKVKKEATSNLATELSEHDEVYINTLDFESYAATKTTRPSTIKAHLTLGVQCSLMERKQRSFLIQVRLEQT